MQGNITGRGTEGIAKAALVVVVGTVLSRVLGLLREVALAYRFGATAQTDAYLVAFIIPGVLAGVVGSAIPAAIIPVFAEYRTRRGEDEALRFISNLGKVLTLILFLFVVLSVAGAPLLVPLLAPGFDDATKRLAVHLTMVMAPAIVFTGLIGLSTAIYNAYGRFARPAFAALLYNIGMIGGISLLGGPMGIFGAAVGVVVGAVGNFFAQSQILMKATRVRSALAARIHPATRRVMFLAAPIVMASVLEQLKFIVDRVLASGLAEGSIAALSFADRVVHLPLNIVATAVGAAVLPAMSEHAAEDRLGDLRKMFSVGLRMIWFVLVPVSVGMILLREPLVRFLFERGAFDAHASSMTAAALMYYCLGIVAYGGNVMLMRVYFSLQDTRTPLGASAVTLGLKVVCSLVLVRFLAHGGLALATSVTTVAMFVFLSWHLRRKLGRIDGRRILRSSLKITLATSVMGLVCWALLSLLEPLFVGTQSTAGQLLEVLGVGLVGAVVYFGMAFVLRMDELARVRGLRRLLSRKG